MDRVVYTLERVRLHLGTRFVAIHTNDKLWADACRRSIETVDLLLSRVLTVRDGDAF